jgi:hypothetical protein
MLHMCACRNRNKPIYVYLNSTGCINEQGQAVSADNEFYAIWAALGFTRAPLYTGGRRVGRVWGVGAIARDGGCMGPEERGVGVERADSRVHLCMAVLGVGKGRSSNTLPHA